MARPRAVRPQRSAVAPVLPQRMRAGWQRLPGVRVPRDHRLALVGDCPRPAGSPGPDAGGRPAPRRPPPCVTAQISAASCFHPARPREVLLELAVGPGPISSASGSKTRAGSSPSCPWSIARIIAAEPYRGVARSRTWTTAECRPEARRGAAALFPTADRLTSPRAPAAHHRDHRAWVRGTAASCRIPDQP